MATARLGSTPLDVQHAGLPVPRACLQFPAPVRLPSAGPQSQACTASLPPTTRTAAVAAAALPTVPLPPSLPEESAASSPSEQHAQPVSRDIIAEMFPDYMPDWPAVSSSTTTTTSTNADTADTTPAAVPSTAGQAADAAAAGRLGFDPFASSKQQREADQLILHVAHSNESSSSSTSGVAWLQAWVAKAQGRPDVPGLTPEQQQLLQAALEAPHERRQRRQRRQSLPATTLDEQAGSEAPASADDSAGLQQQVQGASASQLDTKRVARRHSTGSLDQLLNILDGKIGLEGARKLPHNMPRSVGDAVLGWQQREARQQAREQRRRSAQRLLQRTQRSLAQGGATASGEPGTAATQGARSTDAAAGTSTSSNPGASTGGRAQAMEWDQAARPGAENSQAGGGSSPSAVLVAGPDLTLTASAAGGLVADGKASPKPFLQAADASVSVSSVDDAVADADFWLDLAAVQGRASSSKGTSGTSSSSSGGSGSSSSAMEGRDSGSGGAKEGAAPKGQGEAGAALSSADSSDEESDAVLLRGGSSRSGAVASSSASSNGSSSSSRGGAGGAVGSGGADQGYYAQLRMGARGYYLQRATWLLEEEAALQLPASDASHTRAVMKLNQLLVSHARAPSSTWVDVCQAVQGFGEWMDPISLGCMLQVLAEKGPTPARLAAQRSRLSSATVDTPLRRSPYPVLEPEVGRRRDQQLLRRTITQLLRLVQAQADSFTPGAVASTLYALSLLSPRTDAYAPPPSPSSPSAPAPPPPGRRRSPAVDALCTTLLAQLVKAPEADLTPRTLAASLYAAAQLWLSPDYLPVGLMRRIRAVPLDSLSGRELVTVLAATMKLSLIPPHAWVKRCMAEAVRHMPHLCESDLVLLLRAVVTYYADLLAPPLTPGAARELPSREFMNALLSALSDALPSLQPHQLSCVMVCFARIGFTPNDVWMASMQVHALQSVNAFSPKDLSLLLGAMARLKQQPAVYWAPQEGAARTPQAVRAAQASTSRFVTGAAAPSASVVEGASAARSSAVAAAAAGSADAAAGGAGAGAMAVGERAEVTSGVSVGAAATSAAAAAAVVSSRRADEATAAISTNAASAPVPALAAENRRAVAAPRADAGAVAGTDAGTVAGTDAGTVAAAACKGIAVTGVAAASRNTTTDAAVADASTSGQQLEVQQQQQQQQQRVDSSPLVLQRPVMRQAPIESTSGALGNSSAGASGNSRAGAFDVSTSSTAGMLIMNRTTSTSGASTVGAVDSAAFSAGSADSQAWASPNAPNRTVALRSRRSARLFASLGLRASPPAQLNTSEQQQLQQQQQQQQLAGRSYAGRGTAAGEELSGEADASLPLQLRLLIAAAEAMASPRKQQALGSRSCSRFLGATASLLGRLPPADRAAAVARIQPALLQLVPAAWRAAAAAAQAATTATAATAATTMPQARQWDARASSSPSASQGQGGNLGSAAVGPGAWTGGARAARLWPKRKTAAEVASEEPWRETLLDTFQTIQMTAALLKLLGPQLPPGCLRALEQALVLRMQLEQEQGAAARGAPSSSWRELAAAYEQAGMAPSRAELARIMLLMG